MGTEVLSGDPGLLGEHRRPREAQDEVVHRGGGLVLDHVELGQHAGQGDVRLGELPGRLHVALGGPLRALALGVEVTEREVVLGLDRDQRLGGLDGLHVAQQHRLGGELGRGGHVAAGEAHGRPVGGDLGQLRLGLAHLVRQRGEEPVHRGAVESQLAVGPGDLEDPVPEVVVDLHHAGRGLLHVHLPLDRGTGAQDERQRERHRDLATGPGHRGAERAQAVHPLAHGVGGHRAGTLGLGDPLGRLARGGGKSCGCGRRRGGHGGGLGGHGGERAGGSGRGGTQTREGPGQQVRVACGHARGGRVGPDLRGQGGDAWLGVGGRRSGARDRTGRGVRGGGSGGPAGQNAGGPADGACGHRVGRGEAACGRGRAGGRGRVVVRRRGRALGGLGHVAVGGADLGVGRGQRAGGLLPLAQSVDLLGGPLGGGDLGREGPDLSPRLGGLHADQDVVRGGSSCHARFLPI